MPERYHERFEAALLEADPVHTLYELAQSFKREGMTQLAMYHLYDEYRARHESDTDERLYDAILDTLDCIVGWGCAAGRIFDQELYRSLYDKAFMK